MPKTKLCESERIDNRMGNVEERYSVKNISVNLKHYRVTHNKRQMEMAEMLEMITELFQNGKRVLSAIFAKVLRSL